MRAAEPAPGRRACGPIGVARVSLPRDLRAEGRSPTQAFVLHVGAPAAVDVRAPDGDWHTCLMVTGSVTVLPPEFAYAFHTHGPSEALVVDVAPAFAARVLGPRGALPFAAGLLDAVLESVMRALAAEAEAPSRNAPSRAEKLCAVLLSRAAESLAPGAAAPQAGALPEDRLERVLAYVRHHLDEGIGLGVLSEVAGLSVFHFGRAFKRSTGLTPYHFVLNARIERAKDLLATGTHSITDVALSTGFATPSHFAGTFRRVTGVTPRAWRDAGARGT